MTLRQTALAEVIRLLIRHSMSPADLLATCQQAANYVTDADQVIHHLENANVTSDASELIANPTLRRAAQNRLVLASRMPNTVEADEAMSFIRFCHMADAAL